MTGSRYRLVTHTNGERYVSAVVIAPDEVPRQLGFEAALHVVAGWTVRVEDDVVFCRRGDIYRTVRAEAFGPLDDTPSRAGASAGAPRPDYNPRADWPERYSDGPY